MISEKAFTLPDHSRVWIYQSDRLLTDDEVLGIENTAKTFLSSWQAHGADLAGEMAVFYKRFLVVAVDEKVAQATGCSIDRSVGFVKELGKALEIDWFNRLNIAYGEGDSHEVLAMSAFQDKLKAGEVTTETRVFNNLVPDLGSFRKGWESTVSQSWHNQLV